MKNELRKKAIEIRKTLDCELLSSKIVNNLKNIKEYQKSKNIISYYPLKYEADITGCLNDNKNWFLPKVNGNNLDICPYGKLKKGSFGIMEPITEPIKDYSQINMIIIPACAADKNGYRLGWGKGYYDRFLPNLYNNCTKVVIVYSPLLFNTIFPDKFDVKGDIIISDKEILRL